MSAEGQAALDAAARTLGKVISESATGLPAQEVMEVVGITVVNEIKLTLSQPGSGVIYRRGGTSHQASAPGEPPAVDTGQLRNSISFEVGEDGLGPYVDVGSNLEKAAYLEFGTSRIEPRPFFRPAIEAVTPTMGEALSHGIEAAQRAAIARMPKTIELT